MASTKRRCKHGRTKAGTCRKKGGARRSRGLTGQIIRLRE